MFAIVSLKNEQEKGSLGKLHWIALLYVQRRTRAEWGLIWRKGLFELELLVLRWMAGKEGSGMSVEEGGIVASSYSLKYWEQKT